MSKELNKEGSKLSMQINNLYSAKINEGIWVNYFPWAIWASNPQYRRFVP